MLLATVAARFSASVTPAVCPAFFGEVSPLLGTSLNKVLLVCLLILPSCVEAWPQQRTWRWRATRRGSQKRLLDTVASLGVC